MKGLIVCSVFVVIFAYVKAQESLATMALLGGLPGLMGGGKGGTKMDPLTTMALMNQGGGSNNMMQMMAMMSLFGGNKNTGGAAAPGASQPLNPLMQMNLCRRSDAAASGDARFCTDITCKLESLKRHGSPSILKCVPMMGCCFADTRSMMLAMMLK